VADINPTPTPTPTKSGFEGTGRPISPEAIRRIRQDAAVRARNGAKYPSGTVDTSPLPKNTTDSLIARKTSLETDIQRLKQSIVYNEKVLNNPSSTGPQKTTAKNIITSYRIQLKSATSALAIVTAQLQPKKGPGNTALSKNKGNKSNEKTVKPPKPQDNTLKYNVGSVQEAYFTSRSEFLLEKANTDKLGSAVEGNRPSPSLTSALELWANGKSSKGMFITWKDLSTGFKPEDADRGLLGTNELLPPHAFRFQYNPGSISMAYAGTPLVDPNFEAAGLDNFNLVGTGVTQSTIQFQLLINRMLDMKHYIREDEQVPDGEGGFNPPGSLRPESRSVYGQEFVSPETQRAIYNMGTMYDLEFLLRTIMGYTMKSALRDYSFLGGGTADMGFLGARPVELHLGKNMRYLVFITGINVEHVIFDNRMVPLFSNVSITCSRLPDYQTTNPSPQSLLPVNEGGFVGSEDNRKARNRI